MHGHGEKGFTLLDLLIGIALLALMSISFVNLFSGGYAACIQAGRISQAAALAQEKMEVLRACSYAELQARGAELNGELIPCAGEINAAGYQTAGFHGFEVQYSLASAMLEFDGHSVEGLQLEVVIFQGVEREVARVASFLYKN